VEDTVEAVVATVEAVVATLEAVVATAAALVQALVATVEAVEDTVEAPQDTAEALQDTAEAVVDTVAALVQALVDTVELLPMAALLVVQAQAACLRTVVRVLPLEVGTPMARRPDPQRLALAGRVGTSMGMANHQRSGRRWERGSSHSSSRSRSMGSSRCLGMRMAALLVRPSPLTMAELAGMVRDGIETSFNTTLHCRADTRTHSLCSCILTQPGSL
jgi:hypothetical protein